MTLFPPAIDNNYQGRKLALWIFALVVAVRALQSVMIIFNGDNTARTADGIPLETYPTDAVQTILALFALYSLSRLIVCLLCVIVLAKYRRAVPFMFGVLALSYLGSQLMMEFIPIVRVGRPPGGIINLIWFGFLLIGFALSLWKRPQSSPA